MPGRSPFSSVSPASWPTAVTVPTVSKKSASISVKTSSSAASTPTSAKPPNRLKSPTSDRSGAAAMLSGSDGTPSCQPRWKSGLAGPMLAMASTMMRDDGRGHDADEDGALDLARHQDRGQHEADTEHEHRPAGEVAADAELDRRGPPLRTPDEAGVDETDERDEQADARADRRLQLSRYCSEHRPPEAGEDEDEDHQALEHDQAHRVGP